MKKKDVMGRAKEVIPLIADIATYVLVLTVLACAVAFLIECGMAIQ